MYGPLYQKSFLDLETELWRSCVCQETFSSRRLKYFNNILFFLFYLNKKYLIFTPEDGSSEPRAWVNYFKTLLNIIFYLKRCFSLIFTLHWTHIMNSLEFWILDFKEKSKRISTENNLLLRGTSIVLNYAHIKNHC